MLKSLDESEIVGIRSNARDDFVDLPLQLAGEFLDVVFSIGWVWSGGGCGHNGVQRE